MNWLIKKLGIFFGTRCQCGGKWVAYKYGMFGTYFYCESCGDETYETDN